MNALSDHQQAGGPSPPQAPGILAGGAPPPDFEKASDHWRRAPQTNQRVLMPSATDEPPEGEAEARLASQEENVTPTQLSAEIIARPGVCCDGLDERVQKAEEL